jgi:hypothetical protein
MLKLRSLSLILFFTFSQKAYSYKVNIYKYNCGITTIYVDEKYGIKKGDIEKYFEMYDFSSSSFWTCNDSDLVLTRDLKDPQFLEKFTNYINKLKGEYKVFDNFPSRLQELRPVIKDKQRRFEFEIWLEEIRLEFFKTGDINVLRKPYLGVPPGKDILDIIDKIATLKNDIEICKMSYHDFHNAWNAHYRNVIYKAIYNAKIMDEAEMQNKWYDFEKKYNITRTYEDDGCD